MLELNRPRSLYEARNNKMNHRMKVISVTSGKGGVGKSSVAANLATSLGNRGQKVLLLDGDFGLANLDILFDLRTRGNITDVLSGEKEIEDILSRVSKNVDIIPASSGIMEMSQLGIGEKAHLLELMQQLEEKYDTLIIDTGAGISDDVTWLNSSANEILVVATPEPTSIADAYALIKVLNQKHKIKDFRLLVNQARTESEGVRVYQQITGVTDRFLNVSIDYVGFILWDELVSQAIRQRKPIVTAFPNSKAAKNFGEIADTLNKPSVRMVADGNVQFFWKALLGHA